MKRFSQHLGVTAGLLTLLSPVHAADNPPPHGTPTAAFGAAALSGSVPSPAPAAAAIVDGHVIPLSRVIAACLRSSRARVVDQKVQNYVVERECRRRGIVISEDAIDKRVAVLREAAAPMTLEQMIALHHSTLAEVREDFRRERERLSLVVNQIPIPKMTHCRAVTIKYCPPGVPTSVAGTLRTEAEAQAALLHVQKQIALTGSLPASADNSDLGILYNGRHETDPALVSVGLALFNGQVTPVPVKTWNAYTLLQAVSTGHTHSPNEETQYAAAAATYREQQAQFLAPAFVVGLIAKSQIAFASEDDLSPPPGRPLPAAAAVVDGYVIPASEVVQACLAADGPRVTAILVQNYVVDQECRRRGIKVSEAEIDGRVDGLKQLLAPHTLSEGLALHHTTLAALRADFRQDIERVRLVSDQVPPAPMVRCRLLGVPFLPGGTVQEAEQRASSLQRQLRAGTGFAALAAQNPAQGTPAGLDTLVFYAGMHDLDTAVLRAGLALGKGQICAQPVKTATSYYLLQAISTSSDHQESEEPLYAKARAASTEQQAQSLVPQAVATLLAKSTVVYCVR